MKQYVTLFALLAVSIFIFLQESELPIDVGKNVSDGPTVFNNYAQDKQFYVGLPSEPQGPTWNADQSSPPLSAAEAIRRAGEKREKLLDKSEKYRWDFVSAALIPWEYQNGYWYWLVTSERHVKQGGSSGPVSVFELVVLMDGTVVEPEVEDKKEEKGDIQNSEPDGR